MAGAMSNQINTIMIVQYVVFGEYAAEKAADWEWKELKNVTKTEVDYIGKRKFKTEAERLAYLNGLDDMLGWMGCYPLDKDEVKKMQRYFKQADITDLDK